MRREVNVVREELAHGHGGVSHMEFEPLVGGTPDSHALEVLRRGLANPSLSLEELRHMVQALAHLALAKH